jgi:uncharacterized protein (PEP-CTERM system associated)
MSQDSEGIARSRKGWTICAVFARATFTHAGVLWFANCRVHRCLTKRCLRALLPRKSAAQLAITAVMLAAMTFSNRAIAQLVFDPSNGFFTQTLNPQPPALGTIQPAPAPGTTQPTPLLGTTDAFPPFMGNTLGFVGAPASYVGLGAGLGGPAIVEGNPATALPPSRLTIENPLLPPIVSGALPIQAGDDRAPAWLVTPSIEVQTGYDDNPRQTPNRLSDSVSNLSSGLIVSADTPHLQGVLTSSLEYTKYARATDEDEVTATGSAYGLATIAPDHLYVDGRASMFQVSPTGNVGFASPTLGTAAVAPETLLTTSVTPVWRESFGDLVATDLRYNYSSVSPVSSLSNTSSTTLAASEENQGTLTVALGKGGGTLSSRFVLSAADIASQSLAASTQTRGVTELQYRFNPEVAVIARGGYENLRFSDAGLAFTGPIATLGTRLDLTPTSAINVRYGREDGFWGLNGSASQALTPRTVLLLSYQHSLGSEQEQIISNLNASALDPYGNIVDAETSLPLSFANPELALDQTGVYRIEQATGAIEHEFETDSLRLYGFYLKQSALSAGTSSTISRGAEISWFRAMTPTLKGAVSLGYATETGAQMLSMGLSLTLNLRENVDAILSYQFTDSMSSSTSVTTAPSYTRNFLLAGIRASF